MSNFDMYIPIPRKGKDTFGLSEFPKGGSKFFALKNAPSAKLASTLSTNAKRINVKGAQFVTRTRTEGGVIGVRIWRTD